MIPSPHILVAPLGWGLGHITRCMPVVAFLQQKGARVTLASPSPETDEILANWCPGTTIIPLYHAPVRYGSSAFQTRLALLKQLPGMLLHMRNEKNAVKAYHEQDAFDGIISDNRYGIIHPGIPSVLITHQLNISTGMGNWADKLSAFTLQKLIQPFSNIWIPDDPFHKLAGALATVRNHQSASYIGALSRFKTCVFKNVSGNKVLVLLSGPEPQRTLLEEKVRQQAPGSKYEITIVGGKHELTNDQTAGGARYIPLADREQLQALLEQADFVICRSGYSTLMDLAQFPGKKCLLIPTPGQAEQEYLASYWSGNGWALAQEQDSFRLDEHLTLLEKSRVATPAAPNQLLEGTIQNWLDQLVTNR